MRRSLRACFRFGCGCGRVARRRHPRGSVANSDTVSKIGLMYCQGQLR
jgi:hypothetical protein